MKRASLILDRNYVVGAVDKRLFGSFIEHLGRAVYGGIYEPGHPEADEQGFRRDVLSLVKRLNVPVVRYPGGNFVSGFRWEDSVGPREQRPSRMDLAWMTTETNEVGIHEFYDWARKAGSEVMYAVNLGTRGPDDARNVVEYLNHPAGSLYSDLRIKNGRREPFGIKLFCLGNEMDGPWQMGAKTAEEYARTACEAAKLMKWVDPSIELVACGSSSSHMPTFGDWEYKVLSECYDHVDYVSLHRYYGNPDGNTEDFLASTMDLDEFIKTVVSICDAVKGKRHARKRVNLSFDEWNVWYHSHKQDEELKKRDKWGRALPLLEDVYNFEDALLVGLMLITFLRNADRVKIACMAQLVNVIAPIMTRNGGGAWAQTIFYPMMHASALGRGVSLMPRIECERRDTRHYTDVPMVDAAATVDEDGHVTIFAVNRDLTEDVCLSVDLRAFEGLTRMKQTALHHDDVNAVNTELAPNTVAPVEQPEAAFTGEIWLGRASWNVIQLY